MIDINYAEQKMKQNYMKEEKKITNWDWELLNRQLNAIRNRLTKLEMRCELDSEDIIMMNNKLNELEEENFNNTMTMERLEHSEDKEYLESIEHCKECIKLGINDEKCRNYNNCKTKKFYEDIEKDLEERQSIYDETCKRCSQFDTLTNECCVNANCKDEYLTPEKTCKNCKWCKADYVSRYSNGEIHTDYYYCDNELSNFLQVIESFSCDRWEERIKVEKPTPIQERWIVHRTLRKQGKETYISKSLFARYTFNVKDAQRFTREKAIALRDELNKQRIGKRFLWVVSKAKG